jgi:hypothetical protein
MQTHSRFADGLTHSRAQAGHGITHGAGREARRQFLTATVLLVAAGAAVVVALVASADLRAPRRLLARDGPAHVRRQQQTQKLWFSPGIQDQLNRQVRIGQAMSPRLRGLIDAGLNAQARMVHLDEFHDNEVKMAARESNIWDSMGGNNNGGNNPCMEEVGKCP